jgi:hypothetical protein
MIAKTPKDGDHRYKTKFCWFPQRFNGYWIWLQTATIRQVYFYHGVVFPGWFNVCLSDPDTGLPFNR